MIGMTMPMMAMSQRPTIIGGTITTDGTYTYHTFTNPSGSLKILTPLPKPIAFEYLIVGGGGGGNGGISGTVYGSTGGGGEVLTGSFSYNKDIPVTVGVSGAGNNASNAASGDGGSSTLTHSSTLTARGGKGVLADTAKGGDSGSGLAGGAKNGSASGAGASHALAGNPAVSSALGGAGRDGVLVWGNRYSATYGGAGSSNPSGAANGVGAGIANSGGGGPMAGSGNTGVVVIRYLNL